MSTRTKTKPVGAAAAFVPAEAIEGTAEIVHVPQDAPPAVFVALDKADEDLIAAEIAGDAIETMAYEFEVAGKKVRGLSYEGVNQAVRVCNARGIGRIVCPKDMPPVWRETVDVDGNPIWECEVYAEDQRVGGGAWGLADALKYPQKKGGGTYSDPMAKRKALSKAQRNAKAALIPLPIKIEILNTLTSAQIKTVKTDRQVAVAGAQQRQTQQARAATAKPPSRATPANAGQQRLMCAKAKEAGVDPDSPQFKAILGWFGGSVHLDRVEKAKVNAVLEGLKDADGSIALITDLAKPESQSQPGHEAARYLVEHILAPPPQAPVEGETAGGDGPGEQTALV